MYVIVSRSTNQFLSNGGNDMATARRIAVRFDGVVKLKKDWKG